MIMTMIAHALSVKRTESIVITGMHDFVAHSVGGKMVEKNHHGVRIVTLGIFKGDSMTELCKSCARQKICGNNTTTDYCTGYAPYVETRWVADDIKTPPFTQGLKKIIQATERLNEKGKYSGVDDDL